MAYAIVINLDYDSFPPDVCSELWSAIKQSMLGAGFNCDGRRFIIHQDQDEACRLARQVIDDLEAHLEFHRKHIYSFMKDFYGYDPQTTVNLLLPDPVTIQVQEEAV